MQSIEFIKKKIGHYYLIWLKNSNKYIQMEEPAWFVFNKLVKRYKGETIAKECATRYDLSLKESLIFVEDIKIGIDQMNQPTFVIESTKQYSNELISYQFHTSLIHTYFFGTTLIQFSYQSALLESYLHPLIAHLKTQEIANNIPLFELFDFNGQIVFRLNGQVKGVWGHDESHLVKGMIFMNLVNVMFGKTDDFWLMTVHASAITNGKETILISAAPGSGKTTMAALLQNRDYQLVSDDFVPIDKHSFFAWPFPIAMSVKQGAVDLLSSIYPGLEQKPVNQITSEKSVRYLFPEKSQVAIQEAHPVKAFIFIQYDASSDFEWEKLEQANAVKLLLDQSWISPTDGTAQILLDQLARWSFYRLTYSNSQKALDRIEKLFSHD